MIWKSNYPITDCDGEQVVAINAPVPKRGNWSQMMSLADKAKACEEYGLANLIFSHIVGELFSLRHLKTGVVGWETSDEAGKYADQAYYDLAVLFSWTESICIPVPLLEQEVALALYKRASADGKVVEKGPHNRETRFATKKEKAKIWERFAFMCLGGDPQEEMERLTTPILEQEKETLSLLYHWALEAAEHTVAYETFVFGLHLEDEGFYPLEIHYEGGVVKVEEADNLSVPDWAEVVHRDDEGIFLSPKEKEEEFRRPPQRKRRPRPMVIAVPSDNPLIKFADQLREEGFQVLGGDQDSVTIAMPAEGTPIPKWAEVVHADKENERVFLSPVVN